MGRGRADMLEYVLPKAHGALVPSAHPRTERPLKFTKMHGAGNDYVYIDARRQERDWSALAVSMSDRHFGVGSDGIILLKGSERAHLAMRMYNSDGSEGQMCGNGIRCLVKFALDLGVIAPGTSPVAVETLSGVLQVTPVWQEGQMTGASVGMGEPRLRPEEVPVVSVDQRPVVDHPLRVNGFDLKVSCVSMGNPHAVAFIGECVDAFPLHEVGPIVEHHEMFPERVNFEIVNVESRDRLRARVWERGSGLTMACGTGASAVAVAARMHGYVDDDVAVSLPGGDLAVRWAGKGEVVLEGPVETVFQGEWTG